MWGLNFLMSAPFRTCSAGSPWINQHQQRWQFDNNDNVDIENRNHIKESSPVMLTPRTEPPATLSQWVSRMCCRTCVSKMCKIIAKACTSRKMRIFLFSLQVNNEKIYLVGWHLCGPSLGPRGPPFDHRNDKKRSKVFSTNKILAFWKLTVLHMQSLHGRDKLKLDVILESLPRVAKLLVDVSD